MQRTKMQIRAGLAMIAAAAGIFVAGGNVASAALLAAGTSQSVVPGSSSFANDYSNGNEAFQNQLVSPQEYISQDLGGGQTYDLRFTITTTVYKDLLTGTMDFTYALDNTSDNNGVTTFGDTITRISLQSFAGYILNADYLPNTGQIFSVAADVPPISADRSAIPGAVVGFNFPNDSNTTNAMTPGTYSDFLVLRTNATGYVYGTGTVIGGFSNSGPIQAASGPIFMVPEPASGALAVMAGSLLLGRRRRSVR